MLPDSRTIRLAYFALSDLLYGREDVSVSTKTVLVSMATKGAPQSCGEITPELYEAWVLPVLQRLGIVRCELGPDDDHIRYTLTCEQPYEFDDAAAERCMANLNSLYREARQQELDEKITTLTEQLAYVTALREAVTPAPQAGDDVSGN